MQVELTEQELATLIRDATRDDPLPLVFGPGHVSIITGQPGSLAALQKLADMRGIAR
jgi:hypothetical protein